MRSRHKAPDGRAYERAQENRCEKCFEMWQEHFAGAFDWNGLVAKRAEDPESWGPLFAALKSKGKQDKLVPSDAQVVISTKLTLGRHVHIYTAAKMKELLETQRMPVNLVTEISIPTESQTMEDVCIVTAPDQAEVREGFLSTEIQLRTTTFKCTSTACSWNGQGPAFIAKAITENAEGETPGFQALLGKSVPTLAEVQETWRKRRESKGIKTAKDGAEDQEQPEQEEEETEIVGAAAAIHTPQKLGASSSGGVGSGKKAGAANLARGSSFMASDAATTLVASEAGGYPIFKILITYKSYI